MYREAPALSTRADNGRVMGVMRIMGVMRVMGVMVVVTTRPAGNTVRQYGEQEEEPDGTTTSALQVG